MIRNAVLTTLLALAATLAASGAAAAAASLSYERKDRLHPSKSGRDHDLKELPGSSKGSAHWDRGLKELPGSSKGGVQDRDLKELPGSSKGGAHWDRDLIMLDGSVTGCIELPNGCTKSGTRLVFGNCTKHINGFAGMEQNTGDVTHLRSRKDATMCMHAQPLAVGAYVRLRPCNRTSPYQKFVWYGQIQPAKDKSLCVAYQGKRADIGDPIRLKKCSDFEDGWSYD